MLLPTDNNKIMALKREISPALIPRMGSQPANPVIKEWKLREPQTAHTVMDRYTLQLLHLTINYCEKGDVFVHSK